MLHFSRAQSVGGLKSVLAKPFFKFVIFFLAGGGLCSQKMAIRLDLKSDKEYYSQNEKRFGKPSVHTQKITANTS